MNFVSFIGLVNFDNLKTNHNCELASTDYTHPGEYCQHEWWATFFFHFPQKKYSGAKKILVKKFQKFCYSTIFIEIRVSIDDFIRLFSRDSMVILKFAIILAKMRLRFQYCVTLLYLKSTWWIHFLSQCRLKLLILF